MDLETPLRSLVSELGLELYDVELATGTLNVVVTRPGGVDVEALASANRAISAWLDSEDPIPGRFTLDVSSPGLERRLRTPAHFAHALGEVVTLRERREGEKTRRLEGVVLAADAHTVTIDDQELGSIVVALDTLERARTVFTWGATAPVAKRTKAHSTSKKG
ncbi:MAG TPA: ribosome maturation factor RimP [Acidimicrobiales bacterium]|nr:ribosome maturation factor RimP [Acidimicrobiales bacterium]